VALLAAVAHAALGTPADDARAGFLDGVELTRKAQWAEALAAFERSQALKPHAVTLYNIAACERAIGRYTRARLDFAAALDQSAELPPSLAEESRAALAQIDSILARVTVRVIPSAASMSVDGRPVQAVTWTGSPGFVAGTRPPGPGDPAPEGSFLLLVDPGAHLFTFVRKGFADAIVNRVMPAGATSRLDLELDRLPATLRVSADHDRSLVTLDGHDLGPAPIELLRPAGTYRLVVQHDGFSPYETQLVAHAGEEVNLVAQLRPRPRSLARRWWFWSALAVGVAAIAVATYFLARPAPERPPVSGGSLGWKFQVP
jgi:hypothetical protein